MIESKKFVRWESGTVFPGSVYGRLTVISTHKLVGTYRYYAFCQCSCGSEPFYTRLDNLTSNATTSCGCYHQEQITKHGAWGKPLFVVWSRMMERCYKPSDKRYKNYGARGITVCPEWHDVNVFIHDMQDEYAKGLTIDRIDNNKGYYKENCRWVDYKTQNRNRSHTKRYTHDGKSLCLSEWSELLNICLGTLWYRLHVLKWSVKKTLTTPIIPRSLSSYLALKARWGK